MSINKHYADASARSALWQKATRAQLEFAQDELANYLHIGEEIDRSKLAGKMPHEWGSIDTYDDCRNALAFASELLEGALDAPEGEEEQRAGIREILKERNLIAVHSDVTEIAFPGWTEEAIEDFIEVGS